jgi:hypothetical protein
MSDATTSSEADGVLVASVWRDGAGGQPLVRVTMTRPDGEGETVRTVSTHAEALALVDDWLAAMGS